MIIFYTNHWETKDGRLLEEDFHHCIHVLRHKVSDLIYVTNGKGQLFHCKISDIKKNFAVFEVLGVIKEDELPAKQWIAISPTKNADRTEWFLEKAVEIGVLNIALVNFDRTERFRINQERLHKIALSAMKQSLQLYLPEILVFSTTISFMEFGNTIAHRYFADCLAKVNEGNFTVHEGSSIVVIGPEGDFSEQERQEFLKNGYLSFSLGHQRLRTETAGLVSAVFLKAKNLIK